jgi:hypothetical protein
VAASALQIRPPGSSSPMRKARLRKPGDLSLRDGHLTTAYPMLWNLDPASNDGSALADGLTRSKRGRTGAG